MGTLIYLFIIFFLYYMQWYAVLIWVVAIGTFKSYVCEGNRGTYMEIIEDYPVENCCKPNKCKFLFKNLSRLSWKEIPKEMYYSVLINYYLLWIYSITFFLVLPWNTKAACIVGIIYFSIFVVILLSSLDILKNKSFLSRYKLFNKYNIKYYFFPHNEPYPRKVGNCQIIKERRKWRKTFVTVSIIETGEIRDKVLLSGKKRQGENPVYRIYEICNVYYIL